MNEVEVEPRLWHAYAGGLIQIPLPNSTVYYFPQGHAEHTQTNVDFGGISRVRSYILCKVIDVKFMADLEPEEVYAKIMLSPLGKSISDYIVNDDHAVSESPNKLTYFAKKLSQSDARGSFRVPLPCAQAIFPKLDFSAAQPSQTVIAKDIHDVTWQFRHVYQRSQHAHVLTTGWNLFVEKKNLVAGNSVVFMRAETGDLYVGFRRTKLMNVDYNGKGKVRPEHVTEAESRAANGQPFVVTYYPHASTPEFVVNASSVDAASRVPWRVGMGVTMDLETEGLSGKMRFAGTVSSVQDFNLFLWPNSPWRCLQVDWDDKRGVLRNVKCVSPWVVEFAPDKPSSSFPAPNIRLFGETIHVDQQVNFPSDESTNKTEAGQKDGVISSDHCQVFLNSEDVCHHTLDLSIIGSYEEVEKTLKNWFGIEKFDDSTSVIYKGSAGGVMKRMGDEPFSEFVMNVKRLTILMP